MYLHSDLNIRKNNEILCLTQSRVWVLSVYYSKNAGLYTRPNNRDDYIIVKTRGIFKKQLNLQILPVLINYWFIILYNIKVFVNLVYNLIWIKVFIIIIIIKTRMVSCNNNNKE